MNKTVVILSSRTLFAEGITRQLKKTLRHGTVWVIDPSSDTAFGEVVAAAPATVLFDTTDLKSAQFCQKYDLLNQFPALRLVRIDPERERLRVVTSESHPAKRVQDLLDIVFHPHPA